MSKLDRFIVVVLVLVTASLACNLGASPPETPVPLATPILETGESLEESLRRTLEEAKEGGRADLVIDEAQLTSMIRTELDGQEDVPIRSPQVSLQDGQAQISGIVERQGIALSSRVTLEPQINAQGKLRFRVISASFGPFPLPADVLADLQTSLDRNISGEIDALTEDILVESVTIDGGKMTISGRLK